MKESHAVAIMSRRSFIATFIGPMQSVCVIALMQTYSRKIYRTTLTIYNTVNWL